MGDDRSGGLGCFAGSDRGLVGHVVTRGRVGVEQKEDKSARETAVAQHWQSSTRPELQEACLLSSESGSG